MFTILKIAFANLLLSSDNVLVVALFSKELTKSRKIFALTCSLIVSVVLLLGVLFIVAYLFHFKFLQSLFGIVICYMAVKLLKREKAEKRTSKRNTLWYSIGKIVIGNLMMSLENTATLITLSHGNMWIAWFGIVLTSPLIFYGSQLITFLLKRFDFIIYIGSILLFKIGLGLVFSLSVLIPYETIGEWGLTILYGLIVCFVYIRRHFSQGRKVKKFE